MAQVTTYDLVGKKEDVSNIISNISPTKYPFTTMTGSEKVTQTVFQWQEDSIRDAASNAQVQGFTAAAVARDPTVLRSNVTQIMQDTFQVAGTTDAVSTYGRAKESAYQAAKAAEGLKKDLEYAFVGSGQTVVVPADNNTAPVFAGVQAQIASGNKVTTGATSTALTEAKLLEALKICYDEGAEPSVIMCTPKRSETIAGFAAASGRQRNINNGTKDRALINVVDLYVSPYGEQKVVNNRLMKRVAADDSASDTLIMDPDMWVKCTLRPWSRETLAKTGDNTAMMIVGEFSLKHKNQKGSALVSEAA